MSKKREKNNEDKKQNKKILISSIILILVVLILSSFAIYYMTKNSNKEDENTLAYTDLIKEMSYGNIEKVEMTVGSTKVKVKIKGQEEEKKAIVPNTEAFIKLVQDKVAE